MGNTLFEWKKYYEAREYYEKAIAIDKKNIIVLLNKGNELFDLKEYYYSSWFHDYVFSVDPCIYYDWL